MLLLYFQTGHYIPQLAELMIQFNKKEKLFNLKGIAVSPLQKNIQFSIVKTYIN